MKVFVNTTSNEDEMRVEILCRQITGEVRDLERYIRNYDGKLIAHAGEDMARIPVRDILYIEAVYSNVFLYTQSGVYETDRKLYELETLLSARDFFRCGKSLIVNIYHIRALRPEITRNIRVTMDNDEILYISRRYAKAFKERIAGGAEHE